VLVNVVAVLIVPMTVVQMVDVVLMLDRLTAVTVGVRLAVIRVQLALRMLFAVVDMVHMVAVGHCLAPVVGQVLVIELLAVRAHGTFFRLPSFHLPPAP
jgi:hypothetical protein